MKYVEGKTIPERVELRVTRVTCDICGKEIKQSFTYDANSVEVVLHRGTSYPEGRCGTSVEWDICVGCMETELLPFLHSKGAYGCEIEWD